MPTKLKLLPLPAWRVHARVNALCRGMPKSGSTCAAGEDHKVLRAVAKERCAERFHFRTQSGRQVKHVREAVQPAIAQQEEATTLIRARALRFEECAGECHGQWVERFA